jgi:hypothetical protein
MNIIQSTILAGALVAGMTNTGIAADNTGANNGPTFQEVYDLLRANAPGVSDAGLNQAAVQGLLRQFAPLATLETNAPATPPATTGPDVPRTGIVVCACGFIRAGSVDGGLADELGSAYSRLSATNKLAGLVLDLRYADGDDYAAAAAAADKFLSTEQPLLSCGDQVMRSTAKSGAISVPLMVLVNQQTVRAAEALAGVLRHAEAGLLIGANTGGGVYVFKDFPLRNGERLRVATTKVRFGNGQPFPSDGLKPDIQITVNPEDERAYFADAYNVLTNQSPVLFVSAVTTNAAGVTNSEPIHRINEAELVRRQRDGQSAEDAAEAARGRSAEASKPVVQDPALARALDLLKGLAVVQQQLRRP